MVMISQTLLSAVRLSDTGSFTRLCILKMPCIRGLVALVLGTLLLTGCSTYTRETGLEEVTSVNIDPRNPGEVKIGGMVFVAGFNLEYGARFFGGLSGLLIAEDGNSMVAITDHGDWVDASLSHDAQGRLTGVSNISIHSLIGLEGENIDTILEPNERDAEAVTVMPDGRVMVAFERRHRVWVYDSLSTRDNPLELDLPENIVRLPGNGGIETLEFLPDGRLLMIAEEPVGGGTIIDAWILEDDLKWRWIGYLMNDGFNVVDATALPDGRVMVLERWFAAPASLRIRVRELTPEMLDGGGPLDGTPITLLKQNLVIDNFEGIDHRIGPNGEIYLYMVSDDNFDDLFQATYLYQFLLLP